ncbi:MAG: hypothetical protein AAF581_18260 [Planctomycetota bacterium]
MKAIVLSVCAVLLFTAAEKSATIPTAPQGVPPMVGTAQLSTVNVEGKRPRRELAVTIPKVRWELTGRMVAKREWPKLDATVDLVTLKEESNPRSQLVPTQVFDLEGKQLSRSQVAERLSTKTPVLVSVSGKMPDAYYLQVVRPDTLIVVLGPRLGSPAPVYLPAEGAR